MIKVEFIIPTYNRFNELHSMLYSLISQTDNNWSANVVVDDVKNDEIVKIIEKIDDNRIYYTFIDKRYNDFGHTPREIGKQMSDAEYIIMTGDDNYYSPTIVKEISDVSNNYPELIYWDMIHSHYDYSYFNCKLAYNQIDMGAFAIRNDVAKSIKLTTEYAADGIYVENFKKMYPNNSAIKINKVLFVHN